MTEHKHADEYRKAVARRLLQCFWESVGRPARTTDELAEWVHAHPDEIPRDSDGKTLPLWVGTN